MNPINALIQAISIEISKIKRRHPRLRKPLPRTKSVWDVFD
jgi:hypothetical protein